MQSYWFPGYFLASLMVNVILSFKDFVCVSVNTFWWVMVGYFNYKCML